MQRPIGLASKQLFFEFQINFIHILQWKKDFFRIREILPNLQHFLSVLLHTFYSPLHPQKIIWKSSGKGNLSWNFPETKGQPNTPPVSKSQRVQVMTSCFKKLVQAL